jgi:hypothetical protein
MPAQSLGKDFDFAILSLDGEQSDRPVRYGILLGAHARSANLRTSLNPSINLCRAVEKRSIAEGRLTHPLPALHGSDVPLDKAKQQG